MIGLAGAMGMVSSRYFAGGIDVLIGEWILFGSQSSQERMAFARSMMGSAKQPHSDGPGAPPNVVLRGKRRNLLPEAVSICVKVLTAALALRWLLRNALLKSSFLVKIFLCGCRRRCETM